MTRAIVTLGALFAILCFAATKANATVEFCPAKVAKIESTAGVGVSSAEYSYVLDAKSARTVDDAAIVADTDHGWYRWNVTNIPLQMTALTDSRRGPAGNELTYKYNIARSGRLLAAFPEPLYVRHAWITSARSDNETTLGWGKRGEFACEVPTFPNRGIGTAELARPQSREATPSQRKATPAPTPSSTLPPLADGAVRAVRAAMPFDSIDCDTPFREMTVTDAISPNYPSVLRGSVYSIVSSQVIVAGDEEGHLLDVSLFVSSGYGAADLEAQRAARLSSYSGAISYCQKVRGEYIFTASFFPN